jgi:16S rRNA (uracil1498-N3)-methyltransferase
MRVARVHVGTPLGSDTDLELPEAAASHVARVLRLRAGASIVAFDGSGFDFRCELLEVRGERVFVRVGTCTPGLPESPLRIVLVQGVSRGERMDYTLQKATELGVHAVVPVLTARSVVKLDADQAVKKRRHWQALVVAACEQCGRSVVPEVSEPLDLARYLAAAPRAGHRLVLSPDGAESLAGLATVRESAELLIGPEGGLDDAELARAVQAGCTPVRLGPRILRTETAGVVALAVLQARWGDLG